MLVWLAFPSLSLTAQFRYTHLTVENGLSSNSIQCVLQDSRGIFWIGTNGGLDRYDGVNMIAYGLSSKPALNDNMINALLEDGSGRIWVGTESGLNLLNPETGGVEVLDHHSLPEGPVTGLEKMKDGSIWVLSDRWFARYQGGARFSRMRMDPALLGDTKVFTGLASAGGDRYWVSYLDQPTVLAQQYPGDSLGNVGLTWPGYDKIYSDTAHAVWGLSYDGVTRFDPNGPAFIHWLSAGTENIRNLHLHTCYCVDAEGCVWQGTQAGSLERYDLGHRRADDFSSLLAEAGASQVYCLYQDRSRNLWVGTDNGLLSMPDRRSFFAPMVVFHDGKQLNDIRCRRMVEDREGELYAGTENSGFLRLSPHSGEGYSAETLSTFGSTPVSTLPVVDDRITVPLNGKFDVGFIYDLWYDQQHTLWLVGYGLGKYDTRTSSMELMLAGGNKETQQESITLFSICPDGPRFWLGGLHNVFIFDTVARKLQAFLDERGQSPFHGIPCWSMAKAGKWIWAGTDKGLYRIDPQTHVVEKVDIDSALQFAINDILPDSDGSIWVSTAGGGVVNYNPATGALRQYTTKDGLSNNIICGIQPDDQNNLWISTYAGLNYFNRETGEFVSFYSGDGLTMDEFNRKAFARLRNGQLVFGGLHGYVLVNPRDVLNAGTTSRLFLTAFTRITSDGSTRNETWGVEKLRDITIHPGDKFFSVSLGLSDFNDPNSNHFAYKMEGLDNDWHYIGNQHTLSFTSLPPGNYTLLIRGRPAKGLEAEKDIRLSIHIQQVFYKKPWFLILAFLIVCLVAYSIVRYRIGQWKKMQSLRIRIASDLHDEVGSNLTRVTLLAEAAGREHPGARTYLSTIAAISRSAMSTMKDLVWGIDTKHDTMEGMITHMHEHVHHMFDVAKIDYTFEQYGLKPTEKLNMEFRQNTYLIFKEAINNIVKHSNAERVDIRAKKENHFFCLEIQDNGKGLNGAAGGNGFGMRSMNERAKRLNATLGVHSTGYGVLVKLEVPV